MSQSIGIGFCPSFPFPRTVYGWLGCGAGVGLMHLAARQSQPGLRIVGIDGNREAIEEERNARDDPRLEFRQHSLNEKIPLDDATVDVAYSHNLIECLPDVFAICK